MRRLLFLLLAVFSFALCPAQTQRGKASYYGKKHNGARTTSGERLSNDSLVCAHRTYAFGTRLKVKNLNNGREVVVRVIDRGPFSKSLIIDVSYAAAVKLDMVRSGVVPCEVTVLKDDDPEPAPEKETPTQPSETT